ncbi:MAG: insulinase family protein [Odoribacter sp.]
MKSAFQLLCVSLMILLMAACGESSQFKYKSVPNDPLNARIYTLDNGLKVYMTVNKDQPRIQTYIAVRAGGKNDPAETTGLAHYFEHLMFKGTENVGTQNYALEKPMLDEIEALFEVYRKTTDEAERAAIYHRIDNVSYEASKLSIPNEYDKLMSAIGATGTNAYTANDMTVFLEDIPSNQIENWAKIQSDRFKNSVIRGFHTELETVYEEKNMSLTKDSRKVFEQVMTALFPHHPYGTQTVLGTQENLKNPSITNIKNFYHQWYVPNNMAICLSGDFDPEQMIKTLNQYFGDMKPSAELAKVNVTPEEPIAEPIVREVVGQESANIALGWRFSGANGNDSEMLNLLSQILYNGKAGLIDLNVNQQQRLLEAAAYPITLADYSIFLMQGDPKAGQTLEDVKDILLAEVEKLKKGEFDESLLMATINNIKRERQQDLESNEKRADWFVQSFVNGTDWEKEVASLDRMSKITKQQLVDFANANLKDNYTVVYKREGKDESVKKMTKPTITPIVMNRDAASAFLLSIQNSVVQPIDPVFVDYDKEIEKGTAKSNIPVLYKKNVTNDLFSLTYAFEKGNNEDRYLKTAADYLDYLGTSDRTAEQMKQEFYKLACDYSINTSSNRTYVTISGLSENMGAAAELFESLLANAQPNLSVLENMKADILKGRADTKLNQQANFKMLMQYGLYGPKSPATNILSASELQQLRAEDLLSSLRELNNNEHTIFYYGPKSKEEAIAEVNKYHRVPEQLVAVDKKDPFQFQETLENRVIIAPYDAAQIYMTTLSNRGEKFDLSIYPVLTLYNEYFGGGMNSVVFQEMREARALAYSAAAFITQPARLNQSYIYKTYIATQNDKMGDALAAFDEIINNMPESEAAFNLAKESLLARLRTDRLTGGDIFDSYIAAQDLGLNIDLRKVLFDELQKLTLADVKTFQEKWVKGRSYVYCILGNEKELDLNKLSAYGKITRVTTEEIFGY